MAKSSEISVLDPAIVGPAVRSSVAKLDPRVQIRNPVMFVVEVVAILTTLIFARDILFGGSRLGFSFQVILWLWFTLLFANFAEAVAEGRGKAQADALRRTRTETDAKRLAPDGSTHELVPATSLKVGDVVVVETGEIIPSDGEVIEGIASVNEAAITGESAPVIRESGGDRSAVTGGTQVLSDQIKVRITAAAGSTFLDRMISLVEGAQRQKTPNEIALNILLAGMTLIFVLAVVTIPSFAVYAGGTIPVVALVALFVTLIPTTIGALLSAIGIAGMDRLVRFNVLAMSGRAVEAAGDVDTLLLDKTGTITLGNRQATEFLPLNGIDARDLADAAQLSSLADETPEGRSIVVLAKEKYGIRGREMGELHTHFVPFSAQTRMSGVDMDGTSIRKGAVDAMLAHMDSRVGNASELRQIADGVAKSGGTPLAVARDGKLLGVVHLKDIVKGGIRERFAALRQMGIRTVMITGDNPMTAAAIAAEAGVDDFLAQATPENKLQLIRAEQSKGKLIAMCGDGTNDAPALAQADVGVAMNTGTVAAREAGNMVDLDSDPTKLIEIVEIGKQLLMTRGSLTTFSIANDVAKYFAIIPAMFVAFYPQLQALNIMRLSSPEARSCRLSSSTRSSSSR
jgi:K+-transporting ATPase ATPase B chain